MDITKKQYLKLNGIILLLFKKILIINKKMKTIGNDLWMLKQLKTIIHDFQSKMKMRIQKCKIMYE